MSGWSWNPVVELLPQYRCLVPDLPQYGKSFGLGPFEITRAAESVAALIRSRIPSRRAHLVGFSLGAQVAVQLLATEPQLVDRALLSGTFVHPVTGVAMTRRVVGALASTAWFRWLVINRHWHNHGPPPHASADDYLTDARLNSGRQLAHIAVASAGFTLPGTLDGAPNPTLFITGTEESRIIRRWAGVLARSMPRGVDGLATGMRHDWPLRHPDMFARTVDSWLSSTPLPSFIKTVQPG